MDLNLFFSKVVAEFQLGKPLSNIVRVHGGFMHAIYKLETNIGTYAVKLLNPLVMKRPDAINNFSQANKLECVLERHNIPIVPALVFDDKKMQEIDGQFFVYFNGMMVLV